MDESDLFRVAIVGAGAAGLSTALHLAPLVHRGLIAPIDVYDSAVLDKNLVHPHEEQPYRYYGEDFHPGSGVIGRDIGVGIWSTALQPFADAKTILERSEGTTMNPKNSLKSHVELIEKLEKMGKWVGKVGYTTPDGKFLAKSKLNDNGFLNNKDDDNCKHTNLPGLLFLKEKDFLRALREAVKSEETEFETIHTHYGTAESNGENSRVCGIYLSSAYPNSNNNDGGNNNNMFRDTSGQLIFADGNISPKSYQLVIAADGLNSVLRSQYAEHVALKSHKWRNMQENSNNNNKIERAVLKQNQQWEQAQHDETNSIDDRQYTVFRGNSPMTLRDISKNEKMEDISFQTWGEGDSMRFAAVHMTCPIQTDKLDGPREEKHVWFATISNSSIVSITNVEERKKKLLESFQQWHDPIAQLIESTPANKILMEHGVAHKHSVSPVFQLSEIFKYEKMVQQYGKSDSNSSVDNNCKEVQMYSGIKGEDGHGSGPTVIFIGDASMTIDPVLAQGFTVTMESSADLAKTMERCFQQQSSTEEGVGPVTKYLGIFELQEQLKARTERRIGRNMCLIRATELVQAMAQPDSNTLSGYLSKYILRPSMSLTPDFLKRPIFTSMMKYSLGLYGEYTIADSLADVESTKKSEQNK